MKPTSLLFSALSLMLLVSGCGASKEETASQLQRHVNAYKQVKITPGNAKLVIKGADLLLSKSESNKFSTVIGLDQEKNLNEAKLLAAKVVGCSDSLNVWRGANPRDEWKKWTPNRDGNESSQMLASQVSLLKELSSCSELVTPLDSGQKAEIDRRTKATSDAEEAALAKEKAEREAAERAEREKAQAEKAAKEASERAQLQRVQRFLSRTGINPEETGMRRQINEAMLRVVERNCNDWLPSSCLREYGLSNPSDFYFIRNSWGLSF
jgi:hypothetical protein